MSYSKAIDELRMIISDASINKRSTQKPLIGTIDGSNKIFVTFDKRFITSTMTVYVAGASAPFTVNDNVAGQITITTAPTNGQTVLATYYWQWWTDAELTNFLNKGAEMCGQIDPNADSNDQAYLQIPGGLKNGALKFSANLANVALAQYLVARRHSGEFAAEQDGGDDEGYAKLVDSLVRMANQFMKDGIQMRDDFYKSQGRQYAPAFGIKVVGTRQYGPNR